MAQIITDAEFTVIEPRPRPVWTWRDDAKVFFEIAFSISLGVWMWSVIRTYWTG